MVIESDDSPIEGLGHFFDKIWGDTEGYVYLPTRDQTSDTWVKMFYKWPEHKKHVVNHVLVATAKGLDSYFAPAMFNEPTRPVKENIKGTNVLWAEFDGTAPEKWVSEAPDGSGEPPVVPPPTVRIQSSRDGHEHVYWRLDEFIKDIDFVEGSNRSIAYTLRADTSGWDIGQILRPPYTTNYKHDLPVTLVTNDNTHYPPSSFSQLKPALKLVSDSIDTDNLPTVEWLIAKYKWDEEHFTLMMDSGIEEGRRSHALMRLGYYCAEQGMADVEAYAILSNAADRWGKFSGRMDRKRRLIDIVNRARQKHPVALDSLTFKGLIGEQEATTGTQYLYGFQSFLDSEVHIEWAVEGFIEKGGMGMVSSAPGVGKTQLSLQFGIACALGIPFLGWKVEHPLKILFFSLEMSHVALKIFMEQIAQEYSPEQCVTLEENFKIIPLGQSLPVDRADSRQFMELMISEHKPDGIIIDALGKLTSKKLEEDTAKLINDYMGVLRMKYGCFVWQIHHNKKPNENNKKPNKLEDVYGSVYVTTDMTTVLTLWKGEEGQLELNQVKARLTAEAPVKHIERGPNLNFIECGSKVISNMESKEVKSDGEPDSKSTHFSTNM